MSETPTKEKKYPIWATRKDGRYEYCLPNNPEDPQFGRGYAQIVWLNEAEWELFKVQMASEQSIQNMIHEKLWS